MAVRMVARVLITNAAGEMLLCRSSSGKAWVVPGGTLEEGESLPQAAVREALEETGLAIALGPMAYLQEFRPARRPEHVVEVIFNATALSDRPAVAVASNGGAEPLGTEGRPWVAWRINDADGPRREVRWFTQAGLAATLEPVYPEVLKDRAWRERGQSDPYLGLKVES